MSLCEKSQGNRNCQGYWVLALGLQRAECKCFQSSKLKLPIYQAFRLFLHIEPGISLRSVLSYLNNLNILGATGPSGSHEDFFELEEVWGLSTLIGPNSLSPLLIKQQPRNSKGFSVVLWDIIIVCHCIDLENRLKKINQCSMVLRSTMEVVMNLQDYS